jgi:PhnB protein
MSVIPHLSCRNATEAYEFYQKAFGATPMCLMAMPDGRALHGALDFNGAPVYLADEFPEHGGQSPQMLGGSPVTIHLQVSDCDAVFNKATDAGCTVLMPLEDMFWGDRYGIVSDPYGHKWSIATTVREVSPAEMDKAVAAF